MAVVRKHHRPIMDIGPAAKSLRARAKIASHFGVQCRAIPVYWAMEYLLNLCLTPLSCRVINVLSHDKNRAATNARSIHWDFSTTDNQPYMFIISKDREVGTTFAEVLHQNANTCRKEAMVWKFSFSLIPWTSQKSAFLNKLQRYLLFHQSLCLNVAVFDRCSCKERGIAE